MDTGLQPVHIGGGRISRCPFPSANEQWQADDDEIEKLQNEVRGKPRGSVPDGQLVAPKFQLIDSRISGYGRPHTIPYAAPIDVSQPVRRHQASKRSPAQEL